jgi:hypothetical protein
MSTIDQHYVLTYITLYLLRWLLHVSASMCHLQGASHVLMSYLKAEIFMLFVLGETATQFHAQACA